MNDDELRRAYAAVLARRPPSGRPSCTSPEALLALVERRGSEAERLATLDHAMSCADCRRDLEMLRAVAVAGEREAAEGAVRRGARWQLPGLRMAATVALMVAAAGTGMYLLRADRGVVRGPGDVTALSPSGDVTSAQARTLTWRRVPDATSYRVEFMSATGIPLARLVAVDTTLALPPDVLLEAGREYVWTLTAVRADGSQVEAAPLRLRIIQ